MKYTLNQPKVSLESFRHYLRGTKKVGKAQPLYSKIQTPYGEKTMGEMNVGDEVFTIDGSVTKITDVFPQGVKDIYEVTFSDGSKTRCSEDHLWSVRTNKMKFLGKGFNRVMTLGEIKKDYFSVMKDKYRHPKFEIPIASAVEFEKREVPLDPYLLGLLLGDGYICGNVVGFSNTEGDVLEKIEKISFEKYGCSFVKNSEYNCTHNIKKPDGEYRNPIRTKLLELGLLGLKSRDKFIPKKYLYNDYHTRLSILQGLMDTDGHISQEGQVNFSSTSLQLIENVKWLVHSLGGLATIHEDIRIGKESYYLIIRANGFVPVTSEKHSPKFEKHNPNLTRFISNIEYVGKEECQCIKVEDDSELYLTDEFIVTHNSTLFRDLIVEYYGDPKYGLMIAPGNETGFKALDNLYAMEAPTWEDFCDIVDDLVLNKDKNEFKIVAIDTVDELISIAEEKVLKIHYQRKGERATSINGALGGYGAGKKMLRKLINDKIKELESAGYTWFFVGHTKVRDIKEKGQEESYQQLTSNLEFDYDSLFTDKADIIASCYIERNVKDNSLQGTTRYIYFRPDGFVDAGSRFKDMPERVPMTARDYINAFEQGARGTYSKPLSEKELKNHKKAETEEKQKKSQEFINSKKSTLEGLETVEDYRKRIQEVKDALDSETAREKGEQLKEAGLPLKFKDIEDLEQLKVFLKIVSSES